jgi:hypothetical protein
VTYIIARPKGKDGGDVDIISNQNYAPQLNALYQAMRLGHTGAALFFR